MPAPQIDNLQIEAWKLYLKTNSKEKIGNLEEYFFHAIKNKQNQIAELLLNNLKADVVGVTKQNALHVCCQFGNFDIAKKLIDLDVSLYANDISAQSPIDLLLVHLEGTEQQKILDYLLNNKKVLWGIKKNRAEYPIFHVFNTDFFPSMYSQMTDKKKNEILTATKVEENLIIQLSKYQDTKNFLVALDYVQKNNINLSNIVLENKHGNLLIEVSKAPNPAFITGLLELNQFNVELCNDDGETPLFISLINGNLHVAQILLDSGAKLFVKNFENKNPEDLIAYFSRQDPGLHDKIKSFIESNKEKINLELMLKNQEIEQESIQSSPEAIPEKVVKKTKKKRNLL